MNEMHPLKNKFNDWEDRLRRVFSRTQGGESLNLAASNEGMSGTSVYNYIKRSREGIEPEWIHKEFEQVRQDPMIRRRQSERTWKRYRKELYPKIEKFLQVAKEYPFTSLYDLDYELSCPRVYYWVKKSREGKAPGWIHTEYEDVVKYRRERRRE